jgi:hypothetical protein
MPPVPPVTAPVLSPQWVHVHPDMILVPNIWRGSYQEFFTWLATNNGAARKLYAEFVHPTLIAEWQTWSRLWPALALTVPPF